MAKQAKKKRRLWVIKAGSAVIMDGGPMLVRAWMQSLAQLRADHDIDAIWVTSGAIAAARARLRKQQWSGLPEKQALSAIGQPMMMDLYNLALQSQGLMSSQVLLTYDDFARKKSCMNLKNTLSTLVEWGVVPVLNENDAVATEEIQFGDNDLLSAMVAGLMDAERLVILTNVDGLFDKNPDKHPDAQLIHHLPKVTQKHLNGVDKSAISAVGRGGMFSKMRAAMHAQKHGVETWFLRGDLPNALAKVARDEIVGTRIGTRLVAQPLPTRSAAASAKGAVTATEAKAARRPKRS